MANDNIKWSSEEMIKNAENWSLAGDVALLNSLKEFSQRLLSETVSISNNVDNLLNNLEEVSLKLDLTKNDFHSLRNTQFIENRVYEDDETIQNDKKKVEEKELTEEENENAVCEAIEKGLNIIRKYYDKVELDVSDSEEENEKSSYVLKPKDPYADRPLPHLVGTDEWYKHWHVGLLPSESESESEKEQDKYSSSESEEDYLPKDRRFGGSETSSELDFANHQHTGPVANSTFNDTRSHRTDAFQSSESESSDSLSAKTPVLNKKFAEQLADKLGDVIKGQDQNVRSVNVNPLQKPSQEPKHGNLFSDEPPPLGDQDDTILPNSAQKGLFSPRDDIFSSSTEESFWKEPQFANEPVPVASKSSSGAQKSYGGLFDDSESNSEEDMFEVAQKRKVAIAKPYLHQQKATLPFIDEQPPEITPQKKPVTEKPKKTISLFDNSSEEEEENFNIKKEAPKIKKLLKTLSLFDDEDDIAGSSSEGLFGKGTKQSFFDNEEDILAVKEPQKAQEITSKFKEEPQKVVKMLDDEEGITSSSTEGLFGQKNKQSLFDNEEDILAVHEPQKPQEITNRLKGESQKVVKMFDDEDDVASSSSEGLFGKKTNKSLFDDEDIVADTKKTQETSSKLKEESQNLAKKIISLFDDDDEFLKEEEDIFATKTVPMSKPTLSSKGLFDDEQIEKVDESDVMKPSLFDDLNQSEDEIEKIKSSDANNINILEINDNNDKLIKQKKQDTVTQVRKRVGLFISDSDGSSEDELFGVKKEIDAIKNVETKVPHEDSELEVETKKVVEEKLKQVEPSDIEHITGVHAKSDDLFAPPPLHLFDPTPPPPDLDWQDDKSEASAESDTFSLGDEIIERSNQHQSQISSSLFDDAPPSLDVNNSSGIVKDINVTRVEPDDSSFYPYASSSRRLSSDLFGEQQNQDSFFLTKNRTESSQQVSSLDDILEAGSDTSSKIDNLTPSGNLKDFAEDSVFSLISGSTNSIMRKFGDESSVKNSDSTKGMEKSVGENKIEDGNTVSDKEAEVLVPKKASPGKLKHNLNINVGALLPGAAPIKIRLNPPRSVSLDEADHQIAPQPLIGAPPRVARPQSTIFSQKEIKTDVVGGFEEVGKTEVLHSVTKDRARIPVKRRPSSRRARQEAVRKSITDFRVPENEEMLDSSSNAPPSEQSDSAAVKGISLVFDKTVDIPVEEEVPQNPTNSQKKDNFEDFLHQNALQVVGSPPKLSTKSKGNVGLFSDDSSGSEGDLFAAKPTKVPEEKAANKVEKPNLFEEVEENSEGELFGGLKKGVATVGEKKKASLFDDDEESEEDLFESKTTEKKAPCSTTNVRLPIKTANIKKLENKTVTDFDPLSALK